jgi:pSer/pThr/pTyr-binding forkhead associated (FHA) protein
MAVFLQVKDGKQKGKQFSIREGQNLIGRWDPACGAFPDINLDIHDEDSRVSRKHATIEMSGTELSIIDMGSLNGTILNSVIHLEEGRPYPLQDGDEIIVGKVSLRVALK